MKRYCSTACTFILLVTSVAFASHGAPAGFAHGHWSHKRNGMPQTLRAAIIRALGDTRETSDPPNPLKYVSAYADLNGDGRPEVIVWVPTQDFGGTSGYPLLIFSRKERSYRLLWQYEKVWTPLIIQRTSHHGWRDIVFQVGGGGDEMRYVVIHHNGKSYTQRISAIFPKLIHGRRLFGRGYAMTIVGPLPR
jgi:hypothetical protein